MLNHSIAVYSTSEDLLSNAKSLACNLQLPLASHISDQYAYFIVVTPHYVGLQKYAKTSQAIYIDFLSTKWQHRLRQLSIKKEALARALGLNNKIPPTIVDATGGLARDSFIIASLGFKVTLLERSPIIYSLIIDGMKRAEQNPKIQEAVKRIQPLLTDAIIWLEELKYHDKPDIIYLDPMFPEKKKSALPKKEMLIFHDIVGDDQDADLLLSTALTCATKRVVVKRPKLANCLQVSRAPSFSLTGSSCRFDIYLI